MDVIIVLNVMNSSLYKMIQLYWLILPCRVSYRFPEPCVSLTRFVHVSILPYLVAVPYGEDSTRYAHVGDATLPDLVTTYTTHFLKMSRLEIIFTTLTSAMMWSW